MTLASLQALTWGTVTGAVVSALLLAAGEPGWQEASRLRRDAARPPAAKPMGTPDKPGARLEDRVRRTPERPPAR